jgi:hypothetical protein
MKTTLTVLAAAALLLVVLFLAPVAYQTGRRVGLWLNCPYGDVCWANVKANFLRRFATPGLSGGVWSSESCAISPRLACAMRTSSQ